VGRRSWKTQSIKHGRCRLILGAVRLGLEGRQATV
jgi:hypothetical protein